MIRLPLIGCGCAIAAVLGMAGITLMWWIYFKNCCRRSIKAPVRGATITVTHTLTHTHNNPFTELLIRKPQGWDFAKQFFVEWHKHNYFTITTPIVTTLNPHDMPYSDLEVNLPPEQNEECTIPMPAADKC